MKSNLKNLESTILKIKTVHQRALNHLSSLEQCVRELEELSENNCLEAHERKNFKQLKLYVGDLGTNKLDQVVGRLLLDLVEYSDIEEDNEES